MGGKGTKKKKRHTNNLLVFKGDGLNRVGNLDDLGSLEKSKG